MQKIICRYTDKSVLRHLIKNDAGRLPLRNPENWEDVNDKKTITAYKTKKRLNRLYAACFTGILDAYHHWKLYANKPESVCIQFPCDYLRNLADRSEKVMFRAVQYIPIYKLCDYHDKVDMWPFLKRLPYSQEVEYRLVYSDDQGSQTNEFMIELPLESIKSIRINPWLHEDEQDAMVTEVLDLVESSRHDIPVSKTGVIHSKRWVEAVHAHLQ